MNMAKASQVSDDFWTFDLSELPNEMYHFRVQTDKGIFIKRVVKTR